MKNSDIRVRFAPAPTGMMHLGNVRTALLNYLFAKKMGGTFIVRIEDTDQERNVDPEAKKIIEDLTWLGLSYDEGPQKGGACAPYFQSQRTPIYQEWLKKFQQGGFIYRCFCTQEELERKRARQIALKQPPRYDRTCLQLTTDEIEKNLDAGVPYIWRMRLDLAPSIEITDLAHGKVNFDMAHFSDFALTRQDGSFTFMFANFVDDATMRVSHVIRGEDHLTNTAGQVAMYLACMLPVPIFWHLPILCNIDGKKLSKRDFGFSLQDLKNEGFLPEAIDNYLAIIGGGSFEQEIMSLPHIVEHIDLSHLHATSQIRYDVQKLRWMNHKWLNQLPLEDIADRALPFVQAEYKDVCAIDKNLLAKLLKPILSDLIVLKDVPSAIQYYFKRPAYETALIEKAVPLQYRKAVVEILTNNFAHCSASQELLDALKKDAQQQNVPLKVLFTALRVALMGIEKGPAIHDLLEVLELKEAKDRVALFCEQLVHLA